MSFFDDLFRPHPKVPPYVKQEWDIDPGAPWVGESVASHEPAYSTYWGEWLFGAERENDAQVGPDISWEGPSVVAMESGEDGGWLTDLVGFDLSMEAATDNDVDSGSSYWPAEALGHCVLYGVAYDESLEGTVGALGGMTQTGSETAGLPGGVGGFSGEVGLGSEMAAGGTDAGASVGAGSADAD